MGKLVHGIHHVALKCEGLAEFERVVAFYRDILDMEPVRTWGEGENVGVMLAAGSSCIEIFANAVDHPGQGAIRHVALAVSDVDACVAAVRAAGDVEFGAAATGCRLSLPQRIRFLRGGGRRRRRCGRGDRR